jgi:hypothetical protein
MNFLDKMAPQMSSSEGQALADKLKLYNYSLEDYGLKRLHRLAEVINFNPDIVSRKLDPKDASHYYQALHDNLEAVAILLEDIKGEKDV